MQVDTDDGLYKVVNGELIKIEIEETDQKKLLIEKEAFDAVKEVQKKAKAVLKYKPDIGTVAHIMLLTASRNEKITDEIRSFIHEATMPQE